jgi:hypothetical protein
MNYVLVQNKQTILLGPIFWRHRFIQSELDELEVDYTVSPTDPNGYVKINDELEIYPVTGLDIPAHDPIYEQLSGPFWTFENNVANGTYGVTSIELTAVKNTLKAQAAAERYKKEIAGTKVTIQGTEVSVATDRDARNVYAHKLLTLGDNDIAQWKFPESWLTLSKQELAGVLNSINAHVQQQYDWENTVITQIENSETVEQLKQVTIVQQ